MNTTELSKNASEEHRTGDKWKADPKGYFLIKVFYGEGHIGVRHFSVHGQDADHEFTGDDSYELVQHLVNEGLVTTTQHAAYLGNELHKATTALKLGLEYIQDERLDFNKKTEHDPSENKR